MNDVNYKTSAEHLEGIGLAAQELVLTNFRIGVVESGPNQLAKDITELEVKKSSLIHGLVNQVIDAEYAGVFDRAKELLAIEIAGCP